jgi:hypothetical protein
MGISPLFRRALGIGAAATMLAGCGGSPTTLGPSGIGESPAGRGIAPARSGSWISPAAKGAKSLLYASNFNSSQGTVNIYSYPKEQLVGMLSGIDGAVGMCVDSAGDVFFPQRFADTVYEYAHGGTTPIATLNDGYESGTCSVDPTTGNLAVGNIASNFAIFPYEGSGKFGTPTIYSAPSGFSSVNSVGYDNDGNLFFQGSNCCNGTEEGWLPKGASSAEELNLSVTIGGPGQVQWDGKYITFTDRLDADIYEVTASGSTGTVVGSLKLNLTNDQDRAGWIATALKSKVVFVPQFNSNEILVFKYPSGKAISKKTITGLNGAWGVTLSTTN